MKTKLKYALYFLLASIPAAIAMGIFLMLLVPILIMVGGPTEAYLVSIYEKYVIYVPMIMIFIVLLSPIIGYVFGDRKNLQKTN